MITVQCVVGKEITSKGHLELKTIKTVEGEILTDHVWVEVSTNLILINYRKGDLIQFEARVRQYHKGGHSFKGYYEERQEDYGLYRIRSCKNLTRSEGRLAA